MVRGPARPSGTLSDAAHGHERLDSAALVHRRVGIIDVLQAV